MKNNKLIFLIIVLTLGLLLITTTKESFNFNFLSKPKKSTPELKNPPKKVLNEEFVGKFVLKFSQVMPKTSDRKISATESVFNNDVEDASIPMHTTSAAALYFKHKITPFLKVFYSRIDIYDIPNNSKALALSEINTGVGVNYSYSLNNQVAIGASVSVDKISLEQSTTNRKLNSLEKSLMGANVFLSYEPTSYFGTYFRISKNDFLFLAPSGTNFDLDTKSLYGYGLGVSYIWELATTDVIAVAGMDQYFAAYDGNIKVSGNQEWYVKMGLKFKTNLAPVTISSYFKQSDMSLSYPTSNNTFSQSNQDMGIILDLNFIF